MKKIILGLFVIATSSQAFATGIKCVDGYAYYENANKRPTIIIHYESQTGNSVMISGLEGGKIQGKAYVVTENNGTSTFIANDLKDRHGNIATLQININGRNSATTLKTNSKSIERDFYCTDFSWGGSEYDR